MGLRGFWRKLAAQTRSSVCTPMYVLPCPSSLPTLTSSLCSISIFVCYRLSPYNIRSLTIDSAVLRKGKDEADDIRRQTVLKDMLDWLSRH